MALTCWNIQDLPELMESLVQVSMMGASRVSKWESETLHDLAVSSRPASLALMMASSACVFWLCCSTVHCAVRFVSD